MSEHFNRLTPAEAERLALLAEECAEVIQVVGKVLRHGYESYNPNDPEETTNRVLLETEVGHILAVVEMMTEGDGEVGIDLYRAKLEESKADKLARVGRWLHHAAPPAPPPAAGGET